MDFINQEIAKLSSGVDSPLDWIDVKYEMKALQKKIVKMGNLSNKRAKVLVFKNLERAIDRELQYRHSSFAKFVLNWWDNVPPHQAPLYHEVMNVGFDMARGFTESEARKFHHEWLRQDEENRMFNGYYYAEGGFVVNLMALGPIGEA